MQTVQLNMVHESEAQRRHARVKIPSSLQIAFGDKTLFFDLMDLSASGFAVEDKDNLLKHGISNSGILTFKLDSLELGLNVRFQVVSEDRQSGRVGCEFHDLNPREISALRTIITKFISGEVTSVNDVLTTLSRDNFTKARSKTSESLSLSGKIRAVLGTLLMLGVGVSAFAFILYSLYQTFFVTKAIAAAVTVPHFSAVAPQPGYARALVTNGQLVKAGDPIVSLDSPLVDLMEPILESTGIQEEELTRMISSRVTTTITSPCDCRVLNVLVQDGGYISKGESAVVLVNPLEQPQISARFEFKDLDFLTIGKEVSFNVTGQARQLSGTVSNISVPEDLTVAEHKDGKILVSIAPNEVIDQMLINTPATVSVVNL